MNKQNTTLSTRENIEAGLKNLYEDLQEDGLELQGLQDYKELNEAILGYVDIQDKIIKKMVKIAETEGIEKAVSDETENKIMKEMFPFAENYIDYESKGYEAMNTYFEKVHEIMQSGGEIAELFGAVMGGLKDALEKMKGMREDLMKKKIEERAKDIYNNVSEN